MTRLGERELAQVLHRSVPEPEPAPDRAARARRLARRLRVQRRAGAAAGVVAVVLAVALPVGLVRSAGSGSPAGSGPASTPPSTAHTGDAACVRQSCHTAKILAAIRHPLRLPATGPGGSCPVSPVQRLRSGAGFTGPFTAIGSGPLYLAPLSAKRTDQVRLSPAKHGWYEQKVIWVVSGDYPGPLLLRGARVDGPGPLRFAHYLGAAGAAGFGPVHGDYHGFRRLVYVRDGLQWTAPPVEQSFPSDIYVRAPGCYAMQVDGVGFSETLVFRATR